ncbi:MAG: hypothetical protein VYD05_13205 [Planctomycetota bacterium]|nr:hypothetical protein [Planctomycetota bacterium]
MQIDFDADDSVSDFVTVPAGTYHCRVGEIRRGQTRAGDERWSIRLVIAKGQHVGKPAAWDSRGCSARGRARARLILPALGLRVAGKVELEPEALTNCEALVTVRPTEYESPQGQLVRRNEVPYDGYRAPHGEEEDPAEISPGQTIPF